MAEHRRDAAAAEGLLHTRAGMAEGSRLKHGFADGEALITEGMQVDAAHHQIAAQQRGVDVIPSQEMRGLVNELPGNNRHLTARARSVIAAVIPFKPMLSDRPDRIDDAHSVPPGRPQSDPLQLPRAKIPGEAIKRVGLFPHPLLIGRGRPRPRERARRRCGTEPGRFA